ncbi:MAG: N-acetylmuramoyl-L-alanine amidase [Alkalilacustris sp.]
MVVLHYTDMDSTAAALDRLCDPAAEVSAHYLIDEDGTIVRLVHEAQRAWHAGAGAWGGITDVNSRSIGIELANPGDRPFAAAQMRALVGLLDDVLSRWSIPPERVIGHACMAPLRKRDPGPRFDWRRLARSGVSIWPPDGDVSVPGRADPVAFAADSRRFGYPGEASSAVLAAFRVRFRPGATGPMDATDGWLMAELARRWPVDPPFAAA